MIYCGVMTMMPNESDLSFNSYHSEGKIMESITLFGVELLPHTWPLFIGVPSLLITAALIGGLYELISNLNNGE